MVFVFKPSLRAVESIINVINLSFLLNQIQIVATDLNVVIMVFEPLRSIADYFVE
jgi:hypothetical protein